MSMDAWIQGIEQIWAAITRVKTGKVILFTHPLSQHPEVIRPITSGPMRNPYTQILPISDNLIITYLT